MNLSYRLPTAAHLLDLERSSIREFVQSCAPHLTGRVLDYGAGKQPYRDIVEAAGGEYVPYDRASFSSNVSGEDVGPDNWWYPSPDAILCTQVIQYVPVYDIGQPEEGWVGSPLFDLLDEFNTHLTLFHRQGWLVLTGGTCWREIEPADHSRLTVAGIRHLLEQVGFDIVRCESRASIEFPGFSMSLGWGALAQARRRA